MLGSRLLAGFERRLNESGLPLAVRLWDGRTVAPSPPPQVTVTVKSAAALAALARPTLGRLARCYVEQQIDVEGPLRDVIRIGEALCDAPGAVRRSRRRLPRWVRHTRLFDRKVVRRHYDVGDDFFGLWLDARRVYSCAYFRRADDTLEIAQEQKLDHICRKLQLAPGERFLDIGCGWGSLVMWAAQRYGVNALGVTLSRNQHDYARAKIAEFGLDGRCEVRLLDYRDVPDEGSFDKIASVGMFEHVGRRNLPVYFGKIARLLKPGGLVMNHGITLNAVDQRELGSGIGEFIDEYVFPGGELTHLSEVIAAMSVQGLETWDVESLRSQYARTLWQWVERLEANRAAALAAVGEKLYRVWRIYMAGSAHAFERGWMSVYQVLAGKPRADGALALPATRDHIYAG
ncbi:MAG: class I SAM-dependent methyltransferase [Betaproteobacteria bacterium]|nr:class I SAM-dependent methyltransferase [Betaproteobacteria bacterium]